MGHKAGSVRQAHLDERDSQHNEKKGESPEVVCFFSGRRVPRDQAVLVKLGPGQRVWMHTDLTRDG